MLDRETYHPVFSPDGSQIAFFDGGPVLSATATLNTGSPGSDSLYGGDGSDVINGQDGDDILIDDVVHAPIVIEPEVVQVTESRRVQRERQKPRPRGACPSPRASPTSRFPPSPPRPKSWSNSSPVPRRP